MASLRKAALRLFGIFGLVAFVPMFAATFTSPITFERAGRAFIQKKVEEQAGRLHGRMREVLEDGMPEKAAALIAEMQNLDCECRKMLSESIRKGFQTRALALEDAGAQIKSLLQSSYVKVVKNLLIDLRIFSGSNAAIYLLLLGITYLKPGGIAHLFLPGILLVLSSLISAWFYLFEQNWFFTLVGNDFVGWGYLGYMSAIFLLQVDIVFNGAQVTTKVINGMLQALGKAASLTPC